MPLAVCVGAASRCVRRVVRRNPPFPSSLLEPPAAFLFCQDVFTATPLALQGTVELSWLTITYGAACTCALSRAGVPRDRPAVGDTHSRPRLSHHRPHGQRPLGVRRAGGARRLRRGLGAPPQARCAPPPQQLKAAARVAPASDFRAVIFLRRVVLFALCSLKPHLQFSSSPPADVHGIPRRHRVLS